MALIKVGPPPLIGCWVGTSGAAGQNYTGSEFNIPWNAEKYDPLGWHDTVTNNERITPGAAYAGLYFMGGVQVALDSITGDLYTFIRFQHCNSAGTPLHQWSMDNETGRNEAELFLEFPFPVQFASGDFLKCTINVETDTSVNLHGDSQMGLWVVRS